MKNRIPLFAPELDETEILATRQVLESGWLSAGPNVSAFEEAFAELIGTRHAIAVSSCTAALHIANLTLGAKIGDEVATPSLTFVAGPNSISACGAKPLFVDSDSNYCPHVSVETIEKAITPDTKIIHVTHYAGYGCDMPVIMKWARAMGVSVIEDCAHTPGAVINGKKAGSWGDIGCFSFYSNKNITSAEGGMITTNNDEFAKKARLLRSHGVQRKEFDYDVLYPGYNYRMDELRASIGLAQLNKLEKINRKRNILAKRYERNLKSMNRAHWLDYPVKTGAVDHIASIRLSDGIDKNQVRSELAKSGIETSFHYPPAHLFTAYAKRDSKKLLPNSESLGKSLITLPLFSSMTDSMIDDVCKNLAIAVSKQ